MTDRIDVHFVGEMKALRASPDTRYVLHVDKDLTDEQRRLIHEAWRHYWDDRAPRMIMLERGMKLEAVA